MHKLIVGIEHLMTGLQLTNTRESPEGLVFTFERESPSMIAVYADGPFQAYWPVKQSWIQSHPAEDHKENTRFSTGEAEHYAQVVAAKMRDCEQRSYDMQTYSRTVGEYGNGTSRYAPNEPQSFPYAVIRAMRRKHGAEADRYLSQLRWNGDHWFYTHAGMYVGVEPDGYIHT